MAASYFDMFRRGLVRPTKDEVDGVHVDSMVNHPIFVNGLSNCCTLLFHTQAVDQAKVGFLRGGDES
jgi:hypothetical protein